MQSIEVGGRLPLALAEGSGPMTLKDLAAAGLPRVAAHPYLVSFGRLRLIEQGRRDRALHARPKPAAHQARLLPAAARSGAAPFRPALATQTGYAVALRWGNFGPTIGA